jgi:2-octaprenyl-6-methoxyphenol hydroxylase
MENQQVDVMVAGGGMAGLTMALALARESLSVAIVERGSLRDQHLPAFDGRVSAISYGSKIMLDRLGIWQHMTPVAEPILDIRVSDGASPFFLDYHHEEVGEHPFGWIVENRHTRMALFAELANYPNIGLLEHQEIQAFQVENNKAIATLKNGVTISAALAIAAEGKFSKLRELAGIHTHKARYAQTAIVCTIRHSLPHHGLAQERFLPRGPFAVLPMRENHSSLVWVEPERLASGYAKLPQVEMEQEIAERVGGYLGEISLVGEVFTYPLSLSVANRFTAERLVIIGDAAHAVHPIAGQGINLGFRDVAVLHDVIVSRIKSSADIGDAIALESYVQWRGLDTLSMAAVTDGLTRLFGNKSQVIQLVRGLGLFAVEKTMPLKKFFMKHAMGITGDLPTLMQR